MLSAPTEGTSGSGEGTLEILTLGEVSRIIERQIAWFGMQKFSVVGIHRCPDRRIEAEILDRGAGRTHVRTFDIALQILDHGTATMR